MKPKLILEGIAGSIFISIIILLSPLIRHWYSRWGETDDEVR